MIRCLCATVLVFSVLSSPVHSSKVSLEDLAENFVKRLNPVYTEGAEKEEFDPIEQIPEGSTLLLRPRSEKIVFGDDIYALKKNNEIYIVFEDVVNILDFAIDFSNEGNYAQGWFLREDWELIFDNENKTVQSRGQTFEIKENDLHNDGNVLFIRGNALSKWMGLSFDYDVSQQFLDIESPYPIPAVAKNLRQKKAKIARRGQSNQAELPRLKQEKKYLDFNSADITIGNNYQRSSSGSTQNTRVGNITAEGEVLKHNAYIFASGDSDRDLISAVTRFSKRSEDPELLGPLGARTYELGDVNITEVPLTGDVTQDLGFRFDNNTLNNVDFATTDIEGDSPPGWDVELYRNGVLLDTQTVTQDGRYNFNDIRLFIDDNDFELYFYGPQGEIRSEEIAIPVTADLLASQNNTYDVSVTFEETQTFEQFEDNDQDENAPHIAARYNKLIGKQNLGYVGFRSRQIEGERKNYLSTGVSSILGQNLIDTNFAVDQDGNSAAEIIGRRNIDNWNLFARGQFNTDKFITSEIVDPTVLDLSFSAQKSFSGFDQFNGNFIGTGTYQQTANNSSIQSVDLGLSQQIWGGSLSNRLFYENSDIVGSTTSERLNHITSFRKKVGKYFLRLASTYGFKPERELRTVIAQANYRQNNKISGDMTFERQFANDLDIVRFNANYLHDKYRLSPFLEVNSDDRLFAGFNVNFNLSDREYSKYPEISNRRLTGRGGVSAFVFHDKNGNLIYDGQDEAIEDAIVESLNIRRRVPTNKKGYALIRDLATVQATDIALDGDSLPDPFMLPATQGKSVFPEAGTIFELDFPVHLSGEIEGVAYTQLTSGTKNNVPYISMQLLSLDDPEREPINVTAESDGFFLFFLVPPGKYLAMPREHRRTARKFGNTPPRIVEIGYDGTILKDVNIELLDKKPFISYAVEFEQPNKEDFDKDNAAIAWSLKVKKGGKSMLSHLITELINKRFIGNALNSLDKIASDNEYDVYIDRLSTPDQLHQKCAILTDKNIKCIVTANIINRPNNALNALATAAGSK